MTVPMQTWLNTFFMEAEDLLAEIDQSALAMGEGDPAEFIHSIFRCFHTIKGSGGMCGLTRVADFTHHIETMLDKVRNGELAATPELAELILAGSDQIRGLIAEAQGGATVAAGSNERLIERLHQFSAEGGLQVDAAHAATASAATVSAGVVEAGLTTWKIRFRPETGLFRSGGNPAIVMGDLAKLGVCEVTAHTDLVPPLDAIEPDVCYLWWTATLTTSAELDAIRDVFLFVEDGAELEIVPEAVKPAEAVVERVDIPDQAKKADVGGTRALAKDSTVRVPSDRLDRLVNLVGELVMNQSRLSQVMNQTGLAELANPVQELERLVSELRDDVLGIRMLPTSTLFSRFGRMVHDLSLELGKDVALKTEGGETEVDKSILDQLGEPMVHILRNCIDHGIESPEKREAAGKPRKGTIRLSAAHTGSSVVVSIEDDGAGIRRAAVRQKAIEKGLILADANLSDKETLNLLLLPGFSTAAKITNVSGRGVGMDVVKRQIDKLRGTLAITSDEGRGTKIALTLPLTLAIIEGLLVQIEDSRLIFPMSSVLENVELYAEARRQQNGRNVIVVRGELVPYIDLRALFGMGGAAPEIEKIVIVAHEDQRIGFVVDRVLGTHQTVLQPLGRFFRSVAVASGATIMGDGSVSLILDVASVTLLAEERAQQTMKHLRTA
jgi:two-component system chemotaxis sensor kinase CheA